jgi:glycosyltransferase involved in cell wall biosynthesis
MLNAAVPSRAPSEIDLSIVVPVYNNSATLNELLDRILAVVEPMRLNFEIILVDDGSRDDSLAILKARAALNPSVRPFALVRNFGSQAAVCAGFDLARGKWVIAMDADLENCPEDIPLLLRELENGHDLVCGYRQARSAPWLTRRLPSALMNRYVRRQTGTSIQDYACGMRGFQAWVVRDLESAGEARRLLTPLFLQRARLVTEVPLSRGVKHKSGGHSFLSLLGIAVDYYMLTARRPFLISGITSLLALGLAIVLVLSGATLEGLVLIVGSLFGMLLSLVGEFCQRLYQLSQGTPFYQLRDLEENGQLTVDSR